MAIVLRRKLVAPIARTTLEPQLCNQTYSPQSATLGLHPVIHVPNYMDYYSFTDP